MKVSVASTCLGRALSRTAKVRQCVALTAPCPTVRQSTEADGSVESASPVIDDIHVRNFLCVLKALHPRLPGSDHYELDRRQARGAWLSSQQEHMVALPGNQDTLGSGIFTPQVANSTAKTTYNSLLHPAAFVWITKALGENSVAVQAALTPHATSPTRRSDPACCGSSSRGTGSPSRRNVMSSRRGIMGPAGRPGPPDAEPIAPEKGLPSWR